MELGGKRIIPIVKKVLMSPAQGA